MIAFVSRQDSVVEFDLIEHRPAANIANRDFQGVFLMIVGDDTSVNITSVNLLRWSRSSFANLNESGLIIGALLVDIADIPGQETTLGEKEGRENKE